MTDQPYDAAHARVCAEYREDGECSCPTDQPAPRNADELGRMSIAANVAQNYPATEPLTDYLLKQDASRANAVDTTLASLTERERALVKDAAVMGYVQGMRHPAGEPIGKDRQTLALVIDACLAFPDLYPAINARPAESHTTVEYFVQCQQPDGTWEQASSTNTDLDFATERLAACRRRHPDFTYRLARRTTTVVVETSKETP